jgi:hypothetical protein
MLARATVCSENVVSAPVSAPMVNQPAIFSFWLMGTLFETTPPHLLAI